MNCDDWREASSARLDGEDPGVDVARLDDHLAGCAACRAWLNEATRVTRLARLQPLGVPDLTESVLAAGHAEKPAGGGPRVRAARWLAVARLGLCAVAAGQWASGVAEIFDGSVSAAVPVHSARELGSFNLAVAVGFAWVAWRPARARAQLPLLSALVAILAACTVFDLVLGHAWPRGEAAHLLLVAGLALTAVLARYGTEHGHPPSPVEAGERSGSPPGDGGPPSPLSRPRRRGAEPGAARAVHRRVA